ncbi:ROK family protein [Amycolatopsis sp. lyj-346]|uniref:ROK family transcriptional regulator n=1 Tax=Amycolatopsis sp. lyj-346 TaxID=2789289 RepID=UPI00397B02D8
MASQASSTPTGTRAGWPRLYDGQRRVLLALLLHGEDSRSSLAEYVGLSRTSLTRIARELVRMGLVVEGESLEPSGRGRPAEMLHLNGNAAHFLGIKLTGDALFAVVTDLSGAVVDRRSEQLTGRGVHEVVQQVGRVAAGLLAMTTLPVAVGVGIAGDIQYRSGQSILRDSGHLGWDEVPLAELVTEATGLPTTVKNDVHALTAAHHWFGGGIARDPLVVYAIGAGIGSGVVVKGALVEGRHGRSGRVGHLRLGGEGRPCLNGHVDCVHAFVTIPSIEYNSGVERGEYAIALDRARTGEMRSLRAFRAAAYSLGAAVAESVNTVDPELLSLMGEGLAMLDLAPEEFDRGLAEFLERVTPAEVAIERPPFDFSLYARGAAVAAERKLLS